MEQIWDYKEIEQLIKSKKVELLRMGMYPFDKNIINQEKDIRIKCYLKWQYYGLKNIPHILIKIEI